MQARILVNGSIQATSDLEVIQQASQKGQPLWLDLTERTSEAEALVSNVFHIHPLTAEDMWLERSVPKVEHFDGYVYLVVHGLRPGSQPRNVNLFVFDIILGPTFVITQHARALRQVEQRWELAANLLQKGPPWVVHALLDIIVDQYLPLMEDLSNQADELEMKILGKDGLPEGEGIETIYELKRSVLKLCRITAYQRDTLGHLAGGIHPEIPTEALPYYRDVHDHFIRVTDQAETYRESITTMMDAFLNMQSNRMNATMKTLATISTIMLPLSFIASLYGMNFKYMPELTWQWGYPYVLALMMLVGTSLIVWFKRQKWL